MRATRFLMADESPFPPAPPKTVLSLLRSPTRESVLLRRTSPRFTIRSTRPKAWARELGSVWRFRTESFRNTPGASASIANPDEARPSASPYRLRASAHASRPSAIRRHRTERDSAQVDLHGAIASGALRLLWLKFATLTRSCDENGKA